MAGPEPDRRQTLLDSARMCRLLKAAILAHLLEDDEKLEHLLGQVDMATCEAIALAVEREADFTAAEVASSSPAGAGLVQRSPTLEDELASAVVRTHRP